MLARRLCQSDDQPFIADVSAHGSLARESEMFGKVDTVWPGISLNPTFQEKAVLGELGVLVFSLGPLQILIYGTALIHGTDRQDLNSYPSVYPYAGLLRYGNGQNLGVSYKLASLLSVEISVVPAC